MSDSQKYQLEDILKMTSGYVSKYRRKVLIEGIKVLKYWFNRDPNDANIIAYEKKFEQFKNLYFFLQGKRG